jgi:hypothetical protein
MSTKIFVDRNERDAGGSPETVDPGGNFRVVDKPPRTWCTPVLRLYNWFVILTLSRAKGKDLRLLSGTPEPA